MLSVVVPVYNEAESLPQLFAEFLQVFEKNQYEWEIIFIDDGSRDNSWDVIRGLVERDGRVRAIRLRRNFGKAAALDAGFAEARGDFVMTLDADLQDNPFEIPRFLVLMERGHDVVSGWKQVRHDPWHKVLPSRVFNAMVSGLTGVKLHDHNCGMKCYRREVLDEVSLYGERHRFVPVLAAARGYRVGELTIEHRARTFGHSKYGFTRFLKGFLDLITVWFLTRYGKRPQHFLGTAGLILGGLGLAGLVAACIGVGHRFTFAAAILSGAAIAVAGQCFLAGLLAELAVSGRVHEKAFSIVERAGKFDALASKENSP